MLVLDGITDVLHGLCELVKFHAECYAIELRIVDRYIHNTLQSKFMFVFTVIEYGGSVGSRGR